MHFSDDLRSAPLGTVIAFVSGMVLVPPFEPSVARMNARFYPFLAAFAGTMLAYSVIGEGQTIEQRISVVTLGVKSLAMYRD